MACGVLGTRGHFCLCGAGTHIFDKNDRSHPPGLGRAEWGAGAGGHGQGLHWIAVERVYLILARMWFDFFFFKFITYSRPQIWESGGEELKMSLIKYCHSLLLKVIYSQ